MFTPLRLVISIIRMMIFFIIAGFFSFEILPLLLRFIRKNAKVREAFFGVLIGPVLLLVYIGELSGVHGALTALLMGMAFSRIPKT